MTQYLAVTCQLIHINYDIESFNLKGMMKVSNEVIDQSTIAWNRII
jgi:hypothetical protein